MIKIENNFGRINSSEHQLINTLIQYLVIVDKSDRDNPKVLPLYEIDTNGDLLIPIGLLKFIPESISRTNVAIQDITNEFDIDYDEIAHSFGDIVLRDDQLVAIRKMLLIRRGIMQLATGCFSGDTTVRLLNGRVERIEDLAKSGDTGYYVLSCTENGEIVPGKVLSAHATKITNKLVKVYLDDGSCTICTPNHPFMLRNGHYCSASALSEGDSLMPAYLYKKGVDTLPTSQNNNNRYFDRLWIKQPCNTWLDPLHVLVGKKIYGDDYSQGMHLHHKDEDKDNNDPSNLELKTHSEHTGDHFRKYMEQHPDHQRNAALSVKHHTGAKYLIAYNKFKKGRDESRRRAQHMRNLCEQYKENNPDRYYLINLKRKVGTMKNNCKRHHHNYPSNCEKCKSKWNELIAEINSIDPGYYPDNHKVVRVEDYYPDDPIVVYDLEVETYHNFMIETSDKSGVFVHNSGKTEIMAGFLMGLNKICGYIPDTMILEPTLLLVRSTVKRLKKYGINAKAYSSSRGKLSGVIVTHPASLNNDLEKNPKLLENLKVFLSDEGHHLQSDTWNHLINSCSNIEFSIAMSASVINPNRLPIKELGRLDYQEALVVGATGDVIMNVPPSFYIQKGILANPILFRLANPADEYCKKNYDWHQIRKNRLESEYRTQLVAKCSAFFASQGYKSLILVGTKKHAYRILKLIHEYGLGDLCRCSFGGGSYFKWDSDKSEAIICKDEDTMEGFESGLFKIFIGTSHIYEGADIPNLDAVVLSNAGKTLRKVIQGIGRAIRKTKTGKYAYIVDFTDHFDRILSSHSRSRREMCTSIIGVDSNHIYDSCSFETFKQKFCELEEIHQ